MASIEDSKRAQAKITELLGTDPNFAGVGITRVGAGYGLKVNLEEPGLTHVPDRIDGVPVRVQVSGVIAALPADKRTRRRARGAQRRSA